MTLTGIILPILILSTDCHPPTFKDSLSMEGYRLVWSDEFDKPGRPDSRIWNFEQGFVRNHEDQWYEPDNASVGGGLLTIEARKTSRANPWYNPDSNDWRKNRPMIGYTSSCLTTKDRKRVGFGRVCVRARIPVGGGAWPAIWLLGEEMEWPSCGEIDMMEFYRIDGEPTILANAAWGSDQRLNAKWNTRRVPYSRFLESDPFWAEKFHVWRMDWDESAIRLFLDDELINKVDLNKTINGTIGGMRNPFHQPHYFLINLAIGGDNGGDPDPECFPMKYEVDYVRFYEKE